MFKTLDSGPGQAKPSQYWVKLNEMNMVQLQENGYENFKKTIALNYFTFVRILPWDTQIRFLASHLPFSTFLLCVRTSLLGTKHDFFSSFNWIQSVLYNFLTRASWEYVLIKISDPNLLSLREPLEGNPARIFHRGELISQDLANSYLEVEAIQGATRAMIKGEITVLELGAGYGRDAFVILSAFRNIKYIIVDIPPALWVSETYLAHQFPQKRLFRYRDFSRFIDVEQEFREADIAFIVSTQITLLPVELALVITISSLHEMRPEQISFYFDEFDRILKSKGAFYFKQWKVADVLFENVTIRREDYPIPTTWRKVFERDAPIHTKFFEALYRKT